MGEYGDARGLGQWLMESAPVVAVYESRLWRRNPIVEALMGIAFDDELDCIARAARVDEASRVLDLACGPGIYARPFARRLSGGRVVGLDLSRPMLAYAHHRRRAEGLTNLDLVRGSALDLPFAAASFDVVNCCGALHLFPDVPRALGEVYRVLVGGGRFTMAVIRAGDRPRDRRAARLRRRLLGIHSFAPADLERQLGQAGFGGFQVLHEHGLWMIAAAIKRS
jgi:SAM-dependent methyltransferase